MCCQNITILVYCDTLYDVKVARCMRCNEVNDNMDLLCRSARPFNVAFKRVGNRQSGSRSVGIL